MTKEIGLQQVDTMTEKKEIVQQVSTTAYLRSFSELRRRAFSSSSSSSELESAHGGRPLKDSDSSELEEDEESDSNPDTSFTSISIVSSLTNMSHGLEECAGAVAFFSSKEEDNKE